MRVLALSLYGTQAASTRYRLQQFIPKLEESGIHIDVNYLLDNEYINKTFSGLPFEPLSVMKSYLNRLNILLSQRKYNLIFLRTEGFPLLPGYIESMLFRIPYIYDFDDALYLKYKTNKLGVFKPVLGGKFDTIVSRAAAVLAGNEHLAKYSLKLNPKTIILPTVVDMERYTCSGSSRDSVFTVGWIGSPSTSMYLAEMVAPLSVLGSEAPVRFVVVGGHCPPMKNVDVQNIPWEESTEVSLINSFDVGVMPLFDDDWARGKCAFKLIQYMACGVPVVASPVGANAVVVDMASGYLAKSVAEWVSNLRKLRDDPDLRRKMGQSGRERIRSNYSLEYALPILKEALQMVAEVRK